jgi:hypothetical protein
LILAQARLAEDTWRAHRRLLAALQRNVKASCGKVRRAWRLVRRVASLLALASPLALLCPLARFVEGLEALAGGGEGGPGGATTHSPAEVAAEVAAEGSRRAHYGAAEVRHTQKPCCKTRHFRRMCARKRMADARFLRALRCALPSMFVSHR